MSEEYSEEKRDKLKAEDAGSHFPEDPAFNQKSVSQSQPLNAEPQIEKLETLNGDQEIQHMEVHHHPHIHGKKNWKAYLWEFLMLFLAVTLGFFVENQREHYIEHTRAKAFAASMVSELEADTTELKGYIRYMTFAARYTDTLMELFSASEPRKIPPGKLYWYGLWGGASRSFVSNDATFQQMKSSGSLRYFTNKTINHEVGRYDRLYRKIKTYEAYDMDVYLEVRKLRSLIFDVRYNMAANNIYLSNTNYPDQQKLDSFLQTRPELLTYERSALNQYLELVRSRFFRNKIRDADSLLIIGTKLIGGLKEEYHLK